MFVAAGVAAIAVGIVAAIAMACSGTGYFNCTVNTDQTANPGGIITVNAGVKDAPSGSTSTVSAYLAAGSKGGLSIDKTLYTDTSTPIQGVKDTPVSAGKSVTFTIPFTNHATGNAVLYVHQKTVDKHSKLISDNTRSFPGTLNCSVPPAPAPQPTPVPVIKKHHPKPQPRLTGKLKKSMPSRIGFLQPLRPVIKYTSTSSVSTRVVLRDIPQSGMFTFIGSRTKTVNLKPGGHITWRPLMRPTAKAANLDIANCATATIVRNGKRIRTYRSCATTHEPYTWPNLGKYSVK